MNEFLNLKKIRIYFSELNVLVIYRYTIISYLPVFIFLRYDWTGHPTQNKTRHWKIIIDEKVNKFNEKAIESTRTTVVISSSKSDKEVKNFHTNLKIGM